MFRTKLVHYEYRVSEPTNLKLDITRPTFWIANVYGYLDSVENLARHVLNT